MVPKGKYVTLDHKTILTRQSFIIEIYSFPLMCGLSGMQLFENLESDGAKTSKY